MTRTKSSFPMLAGLALVGVLALPVQAASPAPAALVGPHGPGGVAVVRVSASSTRVADGRVDHAAANLVDGDPATSWQPGGRSPRFAWVRLELGGAARVDGLVIWNGDQREGATAGFSTLGRLRSAWVLFDDGEAEVIRLDPHRRGPSRFILARQHTTGAITLVVRDVDLGERWNHLAISEIAVTGLSPAAAAAAPPPPPPPPPPSPPPCGTPGWLPLRDAVVAFCGDPRTAPRCDDPILDVVLGCRADPELPLAPLALPPSAPGATARWSYRGRWFGVQVELQPGGAGGWRVSALSLDDVAASGY